MTDCACRTYGVVGNVTTMYSKGAPEGAFKPVLSCLLRYITTGSKLNQNAALSRGAIPSVTAILSSNASDWSKCEAVALLTELARGNAAVKDAAVADGD